jgi:DNA-binding transcriptional regulator YiaG
MSGKAPSSPKKPDPLFDIEGYVCDWWQDHGKDSNRSFREDFWADLDDVRLRLRKANLEKPALKAELKYHNEMLPPGGAGYILGEPNNESQAEIWARERWIEVLNAELASRKPAAAASKIDRLRKDCGWSINTLADKTGIERKLVQAHLRGKHKPNPPNLKLYADAFSKALGKSVTVEDLES